MTVDVPPATPRVSVIVPTFNGRRYIASALGSLQSQSYANLEIVVVDDGSSDDTAAVVEHLAADDGRIVPVRAGHGSIAASRNDGIRRSTGELVTFLDQDDLCPPGKIARQVADLLQKPDHAALFGTTIIFTSDDAAFATVTPTDHSPAYTMCLSAALFRRTVFDRIGLLNPKFKLADDLDFILRLIESGTKVAIEGHVATLHRRHAAQATADLAATRREATLALAESLKRRRNADNLCDMRHPLLTSVSR